MKIPSLNGLSAYIHGGWAVETTDGGIVEMGPGDISFGGDQGAHNNKRHRSWTIG